MKVQIKNNSNEYVSFNNDYVGIDDLLIFATKNHASDLFVKVGERPYILRYGQMIPMNVQPTTQVQFDEWYNQSITSEANAQYVRTKYYDTSYTVEGMRYRLNFSYSQGANIMTARTIDPIPPKFSDYGGKIDYPEGPKMCMKRCMTDKRNGGMIVFAAPTGSGKTTTLACCINSWKGDNGVLRDMHIITLEDPIEYLYNSEGSTRIVQKEKGRDFLTYPNAITSAMREHPNIIEVGEMRDKETISAAADATKSGHIVITTFHTRDVATTVTRMCDNLSDNMADAVDLISNISLVVCQRLERNPDNSGMQLFVEYCAFNSDLKHRLIKALTTGCEPLDIAIDDYMKFHPNMPEICGRIDPNRVGPQGGTI